MTDLHTHLLPGIDDGSRSKEESLVMLGELSRQGVSSVAATPHFYASEMSPEEFFKRRNAALDTLSDSLTSYPVKLYTGAEVLYFEGLRNYPRVRDFRIGGTSLLLVEMPFSRWSERIINEIVNLNAENDVDVVLAHVDRYFPFQPERTWQTLSGYGILMQLNAEAFLNWRTRGKALRLLQSGSVQFLGSDCHGAENRQPNIFPAIEKLEKKLPGAAECFHEIEDYCLSSNELLHE